MALRYLPRVEAGEENLGLRSLAKIAGGLQLRTADLLLPPQSRETRRGRPPPIPPEVGGQRHLNEHGLPTFEQQARPRGRPWRRFGRVGG